MTQFVDIVTAFITALSSTPAVSANIFRASDVAIPENATDAVNVVLEGSQPYEGAISGAPIDWTTKVVVQCYAKSLTQSGDQAVDPLLAKVFERLASNPTLSGKVAYIGVPALDTEYNAQGQKTGWIGLSYLVQHRTSNLTLD